MTGVCSAGPSRPSARITTWRCNSPRRWNSTTFMYESRTKERTSLVLTPRTLATAR